MTRGNRDNVVQLLGGVPQQNLGGQKREKFVAISDNFRIWSQVSTQRKTENCDINYISSPIGWKNLVNFGPLTKKL